MLREVFRIDQAIQLDDSSQSCSTRCHRTCIQIPDGSRASPSERRISLTTATQLPVGTRKNYRLKLAKPLILLGIVSIVVSACSSAAAEPTATATNSGNQREVEFYLQSIENNAVQVTAAFARIDEQLSKVWPTKDSLLDAFSDSDLSQEIISSLGAVVQLLPPDEFEEEHLILQSAAKTVVEYSRQFEQALQDRDLVGVVVAKANFVVSYKRMLMTVSPRLCSALGIGNDQEVVCDVAVAESGTYGAEVEQLFKEFRLEFSTRVTAFPLALTEEEVFSTLAALNKDIEFAAQKAVKELAALSPPPARVADHNILLTYLEGIGETASAITIAGANQDGAKLRQLFAQADTIDESAAAAISCEYQETLLHGFFPDCAS